MELLKIGLPLLNVFIISATADFDIVKGTFEEQTYYGVDPVTCAYLDISKSTLVYYLIINFVWYNVEPHFSGLPAGSD